MQSIISSKINSVRVGLRNTPRNVELTLPIRTAVMSLLAFLDSYIETGSGDSETQKSSSRTEKLVLEVLGLPIIKPVKSKKNIFRLPNFVGDYFGYTRIVEHRNECRFTMPTTDGVYAIHQPYGSQANPDILLVDIRNKAVVCQFGIEIKSGGPTWNTHIQFADRSMLYIAFKGKTHYFFGDHIRNKESLILALVWDELQRELADMLNKEAKTMGVKNMCVPYPKQEFRGLQLDDGREERHNEIKEWFLTSLAPSHSQTVPEQHSQSV